MVVKEAKSFSKDFPGLIVLLNGVSIANEHVEKMKKITQREGEVLRDIRKDLIFLKNSYDFNLDEEGISSGAVL